LKKISIITASFNSANTILETIESVNKQTYKNIEHIIIDGASKDKTLNIIKTKGKRITKIISEKDAGIYDAYNKGLSLAAGEIIGFLNSDDFYQNPHIIEMVMRIFENQSIDACYGDLVYVKRENISKITRDWKSSQYKSGMLENAFHPPHPTLFLRKSVYDKKGKFDLEYQIAGDVEFMIRIFNDSKLKSKYIPATLVTMRDGGTTGGSLKTIIMQNREVIKALKKHKIKYSAVKFFTSKIINRVTQKLRIIPFYFF
jgi:glycosyltransferase involved in cell wall biosynthesis